MKDELLNKIIRFVDDQMEEPEKLEFENELIKNENLKNQVSEYKNLLISFDSKKIFSSVDKNYFNNLVPRVRSRIDKKTEKGFTKKFAYGFSILIMILTGVWFFSDQKNPDYKSFTDLKIDQENLSDEEVNELLDYLNGNLEDESIQNIFGYLNTDISEINYLIDKEYSIALLANLELNDIYEEINYEEAEVVFNKLIDKNFNREVQL